MSPINLLASLILFVIGVYAVLALIRFALCTCVHGLALGAMALLARLPPALLDRVNWRLDGPACPETGA
jgi:hypothetical protein